MTRTENWIPPEKRRSGLHRDWSVDGYSVRVLWTKGPGQCDVCGPVRGIWSVYASCNPGGEKYGPESFAGRSMRCDDHRPALLTIPDVDYTRHSWTEEDASRGVSETEHLNPGFAGDCGTCGEPAVSEFSLVCTRCDDPAHWRESTSIVMSSRGPDRTETTRYHMNHDLDTWLRCRAHHGRKPS